MAEKKTAAPRRKPGQAGYTVTPQGGGTDGLGRLVDTTYVVIRDRDGVGLGAFSTEDEVALVIANDKKSLGTK